MRRYVATHWNGTDWIDLHPNPEPFRIAAEAAFSALLNGRGPTRLRLA